MALKIDRVRWIDEGINRNESVTDGFLDLYEEDGKSRTNEDQKGNASV